MRQVLLATTMTYDKLGRLVAMTNALGFTVDQIYDVRGNVQTMHDAMGNITRYVYDVNYNLINMLGQTTVYQFVLKSLIELSRNN